MEFITKILNAFKPVSQKQMDEEYLNKSTSIEDLEYRMREIERENSSKGGNFPYHRNYNHY